MLCMVQNLFKRYQNGQLTASEMIFYGAYVVVFLVVRRQQRRRAGPGTTATTTTAAAPAVVVVVVPHVVVVVPNAPAPAAALVAPAPVDAPSDKGVIWTDEQWAKYEVWRVHNEAEEADPCVVVARERLSRYWYIKYARRRRTTTTAAEADRHREEEAKFDQAKDWF
jgi:hypothetical protein